MSLTVRSGWRLQIGLEKGADINHGSAGEQVGGVVNVPRTWETVRGLSLADSVQTLPGHQQVVHQLQHEGLLVWGEAKQTTESATSRPVYLGINLGFSVMSVRQCV